MFVRALSIERVNISFEAEFQLRNQLEERQVVVTAEANLKKTVEWLQLDILIVLRGQVIHQINAGHKVGTVIVESRSTELYVKWKRDIR